MPTAAQAHIDIEASPSRIWLLLTDVEQFDQWNTLFELDQKTPLSTGYRSRVKWRGGVTFSKRGRTHLAACLPEWYLFWRMRLGLFKGLVLDIAFETLVLKNQRTRVKVTAIERGWSRWITGPGRKNLKKAIKYSLANLKLQAEQAPHSLLQTSDFVDDFEQQSTLMVPDEITDITFVETPHHQTPSPTAPHQLKAPEPKDRITTQLPNFGTYALHEAYNRSNAVHVIYTHAKNRASDQKAPKTSQFLDLENAVDR